MNSVDNVLADEDEVTVDKLDPCDHISNILLFTEEAKSVYCETEPIL